MPTTKHRVAAILTDVEFGEFGALAEKYDVSLSWLSRKAILEFIHRYRTEQLQLPLRPGAGQTGGKVSNLARSLNA